MNAQLNDTHYTVIAAIHEQMPSHLFMSDDNTIMWYTDRPGAGGKEEHSLRFAVYAEYRAFISALEREGYFPQSSVTGLMFRRDSTRIPASVYKPKQDDREQDDREQDDREIHANLAIAYEPQLSGKDFEVFTLIETIHAENGCWWNIHEEFDTAELAIMAALACPSSSSVEVVDEWGNTILLLQYGQGE